jgi:hypothetical protein
VPFVLCEFLLAVFRSLGFHDRSILALLHWLNRRGWCCFWISLCHELTRVSQLAVDHEANPLELREY